MASTSIHSTPSKQGTSARNSTRNHGKTVDDVIEDIEIDVSKTQKADFTSFLCLFLSRCLVGEKKSKFERLQLEIERLQRTRLDQVKLRLTSRGEDKEQDTVRKPAEPGAEERELVKRQDALLRGVLRESLESTVDIANNAGIRKKLKDFAEFIKTRSLETARYHSYADMYNSALDELAKAKIPCLRAEDPLGLRNGLRLCRADPKEIVSIFAESKEKTERKPDFVRTSKAAALDIFKDGGFGAKPSTDFKFKWHQVLSCEEMKTANSDLTSDAQAVLHNDHRFTAELLLDKPGLEWLEPITPADMLNSQSNTPSQSQSKRFCSESSAEVQSDAKRARTSGTAKKTPGDSNAKRSVGARAQVAGYAMEMMSYSPGVVHVINTLIVDDRFFIWYYDRQGCICSHGISIITDFPLFLVLLLTFQRFTVEDWGVVPFLNPQTLNSLKIDGLADGNTETTELSTTLDGFRPCMDRGSGAVLMSLKDYLSSQPHCLSGRMTSVLKGTLSSNNEVVAFKLRPEVQRMCEDDVLDVAQKTAETFGHDMLDHLLTLHLSGDFDAGNTLRLQSVLGISCSGRRTLRVLVMKKLMTLMALPNAASIMKAWFDIIAVHGFLWKYGIEHGDPSLWNMMVDPDSKRGILTDYDLSILVWLKRVPGMDRTGTIPFMAFELLEDDYWTGQLKRYYHHELEAILWALIAVSIALNKGKFKPQDTPIRSWFTPNHNQCRKEKYNFAIHFSKVHSLVCADFNNYQWLISDFAQLISEQTLRRKGKQARSARTGVPTDSHASQIEHSGHTWDAFIALISEHDIPDSCIDLLNKWKPGFNFGQDPDLVTNMCSLANKVFQKV